MRKGRNKPTSAETPAYFARRAGTLPGGGTFTFAVSVQGVSANGNLLPDDVATELLALELERSLTTPPAKEAPDA